jgi:hypothetical protein
MVKVADMPNTNQPGRTTTEDWCTGKVRIQAMSLNHRQQLKGFI